MKLLQLYIPWREEDDIKGNCHSFKEKFGQVESTIKPNILKHDSYFGQYEIDPDDLLDNYNPTSESEFDNEDDNEFGMINPDLLDLDFDDDSGTSTAPNASTRKLLSHVKYIMKCLPSLMNANYFCLISS